MAGYGFSYCSLAGALFSSSLLKPARRPAPLKLPSSWWWWYRITGGSDKNILILIDLSIGDK